MWKKYYSYPKNVQKLFFSNLRTVLRNTHCFQALRLTLIQFRNWKMSTWDSISSVHWKLFSRLILPVHSPELVSRVAVAFVQKLCSKEWCVVAALGKISSQEFSKQLNVAWRLYNVECSCRNRGPCKLKSIAKKLSLFILSNLNYNLT